MKKEKPQESKLSELLRTDDVAEQERRVEGLIQAANAPIVHLTILVDSRNGGVTITGTPMEYDMLYRVLDMARREINSNERQAILNQKQETQVPQEPQIPLNPEPPVIE